MNTNKEIGCHITNLFSKIFHFPYTEGRMFWENPQRVGFSAARLPVENFCHHIQIVNCYLQWKKEVKSKKIGSVLNA